MEFWRTECALRGPSLDHIHKEHVGGFVDQHPNCPCAYCGLTPLRWATLVRVEGTPNHVEAQYRTRLDGDNATVVLDSPLRQRLLRYVAAVEDRRGYR